MLLCRWQEFVGSVIFIFTAVFIFPIPSETFRELTIFITNAFLGIMFIHFFIHSGKLVDFSNEIFEYFKIP